LVEKLEIDLAHHSVYYLVVNLVSTTAVEKVAVKVGLKEIMKENQSALHWVA
jgi:hypothetical protein